MNNPTWPPQEIVHELLSYDPHTGSLTWKRRDRKWFKSDHSCKVWNTRFAGKPAGVTMPAGYLLVSVFKEKLYAHRIIFLWMTGQWPYPGIDHKNRNRADNRWCNLREATAQENMRNMPMLRTNTSGFVGVRRRGRNYQARIKMAGRQLSLGSFKTIDEAIAVRAAAQREHGFSDGHGTRTPLQ